MRTGKRRRLDQRWRRYANRLAKINGVYFIRVPMYVTNGRRIKLKAYFRYHMPDKENP